MPVNIKELNRCYCYSGPASQNIASTSPVRLNGLYTHISKKQIFGMYVKLLYGVIHTTRI